jgi:hypothetical protein
MSPTLLPLRVLPYVPPALPPPARPSLCLPCQTPAPRSLAHSLPAVCVRPPQGRMMASPEGMEDFMVDFNVTMLQANTSRQSLSLRPPPSAHTPAGLRPASSCCAPVGLASACQHMLLLLRSAML